MSIDTTTVDIPKEPAARRVWVCGQLKLKGSSLRKIAHKQGVSQQAVSNALSLPSSHLEQAIADELGVPVTELFPERFDAAGNRLHWTRHQQRITRAKHRNVDVKGGE